MSLACAKAAAASQGVPLFKHIARLVGRKEDRYLIPLPMCNLVNGGKHGAGTLTIQEFMLQPLGAKTFGEAIRWVCEIYYTLKNLLSKTFGENATLIGDEGGFGGVKGETRDVLNVLEKAVEETGYSLGEEVVIALDAAASEFYDPSSRVYQLDGKNLAVDELIDFWVGLVEEYPIKSLEDPINQDDWKSWKKLTQRIGDGVIIVGDDLLTTSPKRIRRALEERVCSGILLKPNQVGTLTECLEAFKLGKLWGTPSVVSHRSGETEDTTISHISVGLSNGQIKTGSVVRSERNAKYNELLRIEEFLGDKARFVGEGFRDVWKDMW
ncbi:MAG: phosphopyruvate hydratase [Methanobacteriota archaeon]|nr:MAG: phosphopyruvate hydratase [Euryarchaeota archaeon]